MAEARKPPSGDFEALPYGRDPWRLVADRAALSLPQTPPVFVLGNGFVGLRGPGGAAGEAKLYLNGVFERMPIAYHEAAHGYARESDTRLPVADPSDPGLAIDGAPIAAWDRATLDMRRGLLTLEAERDGVRVTLERLVAADRPLVATRLTIAAARPATVTLAPSPGTPPAAGTSEEGLYDPRVGPHFGASPWRTDASHADARVDRLATSGWRVATAVWGAAGTFDLAPGDTIVRDLLAAVVAAPDRDADALLADARALVADESFDALAGRQAAWFADLWAATGLSLPDLPAAEQALRHGLFQLVQAAARDARSSIAAKGQTGEGYEGHVFWDADTYVLPVLAHIVPATARAMLAWRIAGLDDARENARAMGQARGALYPWRTIAGRECSSFFPAGSAQYHINADVALALRLYVAATGDERLLAQGGAEMLAETARVWLEIGFHDPERGGAFVINRVTGPDEYSAIVDNNLYTNLMAREHLRYAVEVAHDFLDADERAAMTRAADAMLIPHDTERGIPAQDDRFFALEPWPFADTPADRYPLLLHYHPLAIYRRRVAKQADAVLAAALLPDLFDRDARARMLDAYEAVTVHDSTLSASAFAIAAAQVGEVERGFDYWRTSVLTDLCDLFGNSGHGLHMAALAGGWNALAFGFAGMQVVGGLRFDPRAVPGLGRYAFAVAHRGARLAVSVGAEAVTYALEAGEQLAFEHRGERIILTAARRAVDRPL